jgi:hypothetical protein
MDDGALSTVFFWGMKDIFISQPTSGLLSLRGQSKSHQLKRWLSNRQMLTVWCDVTFFGLWGLHPFANDAGIMLTVTLDHYTEMLFNFLAPELWQHGFDLQMWCF